jgi:hypothetical protein
MDSNKALDNQPSFLTPIVQQYGSNMVMTNVYQPIKIKYINIDTRFLDHKNVTDTQLMMNLPERINNVKSVEIIQAEIPITFYNISTALGNNTCKIIDNETKTTTMITIPDGNYTSSSLIDIINKNAGFVNKLTLSNPSIDTATATTGFNTGITVLSNTANPNKYTIVWFDGTFTGSIKAQLGWLLGFRKANYSLPYTTTIGNTSSKISTITSEAFMDIDTVKYIYLAIEEFHNTFPNSFVSPMTNNVLNQKPIARIQINKNLHPFGTVMKTSKELGSLCSDIRTYVGFVDLQKLKLMFVNEWGSPIIFNGLDYSFIMKLEYA